MFTAQNLFKTIQSTLTVNCKFASTVTFQLRNMGRQIDSNIHLNKIV